jgi:hypothetical protein
MKILHFIDDDAAYDEHYVPAKNITCVEITSNAAVKVWWANSDTNISDHMVDIAVTAGTADECLLAISEHLIDTGIHSHGVVSIQAGGQIPNSYGFSGAIATIDYTAGS